MDTTCPRCSRVFVSPDGFALLMLYVWHALNKEREGCIGASRGDFPTLGQILADARRERLH